MKKYINTILIMAVAGAFLSGVLLYQHYFPELELGYLSCGKGFTNPCVAVGQSEYSTILGIPVAAFGLVYFTLIAFLSLIADYAGDKYYRIFCGVVFPLTVAGIAADLVLAVLMIKIGVFCALCFTTYIFNIAIFFSLIAFIRKHFTRRELGESLSGFFKPEGSDQKASLSFSVLFSFFLVFAVFSTATIIKVKSESGKSNSTERLKMITDFYRQPVEDIKFIPSSLTIGKHDSKVKIYIFNDFLCSACYKLFLSEKQLLAKYRDKIEIIYYHYPLDKACNKYMDSSIYKNSCLASKTMNAASAAGFFEEYFFTHFSNYKKYKNGFSQDNIQMNLEEITGNFRIEPFKIQKFESESSGSGMDDETVRHIEFAEKLKIDATPTLIISGRRIVGVPPGEMLEGIIETELSK